MWAVALTLATGHARGRSKAEPERPGRPPKAESGQRVPDCGWCVERHSELRFRVSPSNAAQVDGDGANIRARRANCFCDRLFGSTPARHYGANCSRGDGHGRPRGRVGTACEA